MNKALNNIINREIQAWEGEYGKKVKYIGDAAEVSLPRFLRPEDD